MGKSYLKHKEVPPDLSKAWGRIRTVIRESSSSCQNTDMEALNARLSSLKITPTHQENRSIFDGAIRRSDETQRHHHLQLRRVEPGHFNQYSIAARRIMQRMGFHPDQPDAPNVELELLLPWHPRSHMSTSPSKKSGC